MPCGSSSIAASRLCSSAEGNANVRDSTVLCVIDVSEEIFGVWGVICRSAGSRVQDNTVFTESSTGVVEVKGGEEFIAIAWAFDSVVSRAVASIVWMDGVSFRGLVWYL